MLNSINDTLPFEYRAYFQGIRYLKIQGLSSYPNWCNPDMSNTYSHAHGLQEELKGKRQYLALQTSFNGLISTFSGYSQE
jgi:hypothetical protein